MKTSTNKGIEMTPCKSGTYCNRQFNKGLHETPESAARCKWMTDRAAWLRAQSSTDEPLVYFNDGQWWVTYMGVTTRRYI